MRFISFESPSGPGWGACRDQGIVDLSLLAPSLRKALAAGVLPASPVALPAGTRTWKTGEVKLLTPLPDATRFFCIGLNYAAHREEADRRPTAQPVVFVRYAASLVGDRQPLLAPPESETYDFEGELAVIIGRPGRRIAEADALEHVGGYACFMDGSIREFQMQTSQYTPGKNFDRSGAFGPCLVTADEIGDPNAGLRLQTRLNGERVQDATTDLMLFPVPSLIAYISTFTVLQPGDVIATGTPGGVGFARKPPLYMRPGDRIEVEIERVGLLANPVQADAG
ncbi:MAG: fumarylacetoacetate hydrolase family protein [Gammaproteobacteria bacterium]|nr:fumarylacetoacetate hydrolase family protein [Gammaproteobacteria bacterium]